MARIRLAMYCRCVLRERQARGVAIVAEVTRGSFLTRAADSGFFFTLLETIWPVQERVKELVAQIKANTCTEVNLAGERMIVRFVCFSF